MNNSSQNLSFLDSFNNKRSISDGGILKQKSQLTQTNEIQNSMIQNPEFLNDLREDDINQEDSLSLNIEQQNQSFDLYSEATVNISQQKVVKLQKYKLPQYSEEAYIMSKQNLKNSIIYNIKLISDQMKENQTKLKNEQETQIIMKKNKFMTKIYKIYQKLIISPDNYILKFWDIQMFLIIIVVSTYILYLDIFQDQLEKSSLYQAFNSYFAIAFIVDFIIQFFIAYYNKFNLIVTDPKKILTNYLKGFLILDFLSAIPFDFLSEYIQVKNNSYFSVIKIPKVFKIIKTLKLIKLPMLKRIKFIKQFMNNLDSGIIRFLLLVFLAIILIHLSSCIFYTIAQMNDFGPDTWVYNQYLVNANPFELYISSFYWSTQTITTVGFGDFALQNQYEKLFANIWIIIGAAFYSFLISNLQSLAKSKVIIENDMYSINKINQFSLDINLPPEILQKVKKYIYQAQQEFGYQSKIDNGLDIHQLPYTLLAQVRLQTHHKLISRIHLFLYQPVDCILQILNYLTPIYFEKGEIVYTQGEQSDEIYFICKGEVTLKNIQGHDILTYHENENFGGIEIIQNLSHRKYLTIAHSNVWLIYLNKKEFMNIYNQFPSFYFLIRKEIENQQRDIDNQVKQNLYEQNQNKSVLQMGVLLSDKKRRDQSQMKKIENQNYYKHEYQAINTKFQIQKEVRAKRVRNNQINNGFGMLIKQYDRLNMHFNDEDLNIYRKVQNEDYKKNCYDQLQNKIIKEFKTIKQSSETIKSKYIKKLNDRKVKIKQYEEYINKNMEKIKEIQEKIQDRLNR